MIALLQLLGLNGLNVLDLVAHHVDVFVLRIMTVMESNLKKRNAKMSAIYVFNQSAIRCLKAFSTVLCSTTQKSSNQEIDESSMAYL